MGEQEYRIVVGVDGSGPSMAALALGDPTGQTDGRLRRRGERVAVPHRIRLGTDLGEQRLSPGNAAR